MQPEMKSSRDTSSSNSDRYHTFLQRRPQPWGEERAGGEPSQLESVSWPPDLSQDPADVLFLNPVVGNCALLSDLIAPHSSLVRFILTPVNPTLPPPMLVAPDFVQHWHHHLRRSKEFAKDEDWVYRSMSYHFLAQCSVAQTAALLEPYGFQLLHLEHAYAVFGKIEELPEVRTSTAFSKHLDPNAGSMVVHRDNHSTHTKYLTQGTHSTARTA